MNYKYFNSILLTAFTIFIFTILNLNVSTGYTVGTDISNLATIITENEGTEYFVKRSSNQQTLHLQDTCADPGPNNVNIVLISTSQLNGHATSKFDDGTIWYDEENYVYKMWVLASTGPNGYWSVYYAESDSLINWNVTNIQECYYGVSDSYDITRQATISVLKESNTSFKMWFHNYQASGWKTQIWYRASTNGITWTEPQLVIPAVSLDDWRFPTALHLTNGKYRLYYDYIYRDVYNYSYLYRADVESNGITTSNVIRYDTVTLLNAVLGATIIGDKEGDNHHRVWVGGSNLFRFDSFDEGQTWTDTTMGTYNTANYSIVETFYYVIPLTVDAGMDTTIYYGYGPETAILTATASRGTAPYSYLWSNNATTQSITVSPTITKNYTVIVTDANNNTASDDVMVNVIDVRCGCDSSKVLVCHNVYHNPHTICIDSHAVLAHLKHGDYLGYCDTLTVITLQEQPAEFKLYANYPNPFNPVTNIQFDLPKDVFIKLSIYDVLGREVATLVNEFKKGGRYIVAFNGSELSSGIYFYRIEAGSFSDIKKMILIK